MEARFNVAPRIEIRFIRGWVGSGYRGKRQSQRRSKFPGSLQAEEEIR